MVDLSPYQDKINRAMQEADICVGDPRQAFIGLLKSEGFTPPRNAVFDGRIDRIDSPEDERVGKLSGWYWYNEYEIGDEIIGIARYG